MTRPFSDRDWRSDERASSRSAASGQGEVGAGLNGDVSVMSRRPDDPRHMAPRRLQSRLPGTFSPMDLERRLQETMADTYRIERELGGGGMSRVFAATEIALGRRVAIKLLTELSSVVSGDHLMPYLEGESLRARLAREGQLPLPEVVRLLREILDALDYAHAQGVVHRDIKPDNILPTAHHAVVTDFGVAKAVLDARQHRRACDPHLTGAANERPPHEGVAGPARGAHGRGRSRNAGRLRVTR